ncbi:MAG TPA: nucleotidyl transferase AbiEii/AbiGii toxin family protein [Pseudonocardiaceae bacterium]|jgi:predicted nucleotidyltransferase component of viral defense system|nr:nucleotidyl transferase AbiEii/AbiGii toxin family protein [Pseudonocardiaceae bacterium]
MPNPTRDTVAGRVYNDLRNLARRTGRPTDEVMLEYVLERFLYRLSIHPLGGQHFVLKGGLLLAQFGARRMTRDIDILGRAFPDDAQEITRRISMIAATQVDDGITFAPESLTTVPIRQEDEYHGLRLVMTATLSRAHLKLQLDISFGDPVTPGPTKIEYRQYLSAQPFTLYGYPIATVIAEKLSTAVALGDLNTRDRDYADLYQLITRHHLDGDELSEALAATAEHRGIRLRPLSSAITDLPTRRQRSYTAWLRRQGPAARDHPEQFADLVAAVTAFADPLLADAVRQRIWDPSTTTWS